MDRRPVELVRVEREERYYDREEVLGRDTSSVFPSEAKKAAAGGAALAELLGGGNRKFISETELEEIKSKRGLSVEDGTIAADKPLAEILREAKEAKEAAFQEQWKQMKQGKNRPLDEDELEFLDSVAQQEADRLRQARREEEEALAAFHAAQQAREAEHGSSEAAADQQPGVGAGPADSAGVERSQQLAGPAKQQQAAPKKQPLVAIRPLVRPVVKVKGAVGSPGGAAGSGAGAGISSGRQAAKRQRTDSGQPAQQGQKEGSTESEEEPGLAGLLGGYGSGSDSDA